MIPSKNGNKRGKVSTFTAEVLDETAVLWFTADDCMISVLIGENAKGLEFDAVVVMTADIRADELPLARVELRTRAVELMETVWVIVRALGLCGHAVEGILRDAVENVRAGAAQNAHYLSLSDAGTLGSRMHLSRDAHRQAAREIVDGPGRLLGPG